VKCFKFIINDYQCDMKVGGVQWVARLIRNWWMPVIREF